MVGFRGMGTFSNPEVRVLLIDRSEGSPRTIRDQSVRDLTWLRACSSDGRYLYLAGENERIVNQPGFRNQQMIQSLRVVRVDPDDLTIQDLVKADATEELHVRRLAVGFGLVAVCAKGGRLAVYRVQDGVGTQPIYTNRYRGEISAACLDEGHVVVTSGDETKVVPIR